MTRFFRFSFMAAGANLVLLSGVHDSTGPPVTLLYMPDFPGAANIFLLYRLGGPLLSVPYVTLQRGGEGWGEGEGGAVHKTLLNSEQLCTSTEIDVFEIGQFCAPGSMSFR